VSSERVARGEQGSALVELTWLGLLLLVPLIWIVVSVFEVQRGAFATAGASRAAARAFALAPDDPEGRRQAVAAARRVMRDQGASPASEVTVSCVPEGDCHTAGAMITVRVSSSVQLPLFPDLFGEQRTSFALSSTHTVPIGRYQESQ
jgi:hypothetical protein